MWQPIENTSKNDSASHNLKENREGSNKIVEVDLLGTCMMINPLFEVWRTLIRLGALKI